MDIKNITSLKHKTLYVDRSWMAVVLFALFFSILLTGCAEKTPSTFEATQTTKPSVSNPDASLTRAEAAIVILLGMHGNAYLPPAASGTIFSDVSADSFGAAWIEEFTLEGITSGCGDGKYCPDTNITRAQMAVFLLKGKYGSSYVPPVANGIFSDVPVGSFGANWIEQFVLEGIGSDCGSGMYCPSRLVTRAEMAVFLKKTFNLP